MQLFEHLDKADTQDVDGEVASASVDDYDALVLPGGVANPDALRMDADAVAFVKAFVESGKPVAAICHAPWTLIEADVVRGKRITSWPSLQTDLRNAGAEWVDEQVVDGRQPDHQPQARRPAGLHRSVARGRQPRRLERGVAGRLRVVLRLTQASV